MRFLNFYTSTQ